MIGYFVLPIFESLGTCLETFTKKDIALLRQAVCVASTMAYDAAVNKKSRYIENPVPGFYLTLYNDDINII